ncbi:hypothetical protein OROGR_016500 [Orobanche gracilis]
MPPLLRAEYWQTLYSTVSMGAPYLILCSEDDDLAPFHIIFNFATRLKDLGGDVKLVKWSSSSHVGHFRNYPDEYRAAVIELLGRAVLIYSHKLRQHEGERMSSEGPHDGVSSPSPPLVKIAARSNQSFSRNVVDLNDRFLMHTSLDYHEDRYFGSVHDEHIERYMSLSGPSEVGANGVLGQFLFDVCVPKNVEDWDLTRSPASLRKSTFHFNPMKCIRRSRL